MPQLRKWLFATMTALALPAPLMTALPARADSAASTAGQTRVYVVYARGDPDDAWTCVGVYDSYNDAKAVADYLYDLGCQIFIR